MLDIGDKIPQFVLPNQDGEMVKSSQFEGNPLVVYFYPRDSSPACTIEACSFRDYYPKFKKRKIPVIGISTDDIASHKRFCVNNKLLFILLSDPVKNTINAFGAWGEKKIFGVPRKGIIRATFIIDSEGRVKNVFPRVKPAGHAAEVLAALDA